MSPQIGGRRAAAASPTPPTDPAHKTSTGTSTPGGASKGKAAPRGAGPRALLVSGAPSILYTINFECSQVPGPESTFKFAPPRTRYR